MTNVIAYYRVSTKGQGESGLGLDAQREYIERAAQSNGWSIVGEFTETVSGTVAPVERPECSKALAACKGQNALLVVAKLDRLSRSVLHIAQMMEHTEFKVATMPTANTFQLHLFAALAQQEREFISQRTKDALASLKRDAEAGDAEAQAKIARRDAGLAAARASKNTVQARAVRTANVTSYQKSVETEIKLCMYTCKTLQSVADCLNGKGVSTPRGSEFTATAVRRLMLALNLNFQD